VNHGGSTGHGGGGGGGGGARRGGRSARPGVVRAQQRVHARRGEGVCVRSQRRWLACNAYARRSLAPHHTVARPGGGAPQVENISPLLQEPNLRQFFGLVGFVRRVHWTTTYGRGTL